jgi:hypothetical protein
MLPSAMENGKNGILKSYRRARRDRGEILTRFLPEWQQKKKRAPAGEPAGALLQGTLSGLLPDLESLDMSGLLSIAFGT